MRLPANLTALTDEQKKRFDDHVWLAKQESRVRAGHVRVGKKETWVRRGLDRSKRREGDLEGDLYSAALHGLLVAAAAYSEDDTRVFPFFARPRIRNAMRRRWYENLGDTHDWENFQKRKNFILIENRLGKEGREALTENADHREPGIKDVDDRDEVESLLKAMKPRDAFCLNWYYIEGRRAGELADALGVYPTYAYECLSLARKAARAWADERRAV